MKNTDYSPLPATSENPPSEPTLLTFAVVERHDPNLVTVAIVDPPRPDLATSSNDDLSLTMKIVISVGLFALSTFLKPILLKFLNHIFNEGNPSPNDSLVVMMVYLASALFGYLFFRKNPKNAWVIYVLIACAVPGVMFFAILMMSVTIVDPPPPDHAAASPHSENDHSSLTTKIVIAIGLLFALNIFLMAVLPKFLNHLFNEGNPSYDCVSFVVMMVYLVSCLFASLFIGNNPKLMWFFQYYSMACMFAAIFFIIIPLFIG